MSTENPFAAPESAGEVKVVATAGPFYDANAVMVSAFLGGFLGGALTIFLNERALGRDGWAVMAIGLGASFVLAILAMVLPEQIPGVAYTMATIFACKGWMESTHGPQVAEAVAEGAELHSRWRAAGMGLLMLLPTVIVLFAVVVPWVLLFEA